MENDNKKHIEVAKLTKTQGLKGDLRAVLCCDSPEVLRGFKTFLLGESKTPIEVELREVRKGFVVLRL
ncbi:MAG: 16S rRNA processing protein RimM, partial [Oscillospiraceae bacterium]|nr:16S rRNA processing protein RimM [Oscillospiraceae bacterium]